jgi:hypothetical protein
LQLLWSDEGREEWFSLRENHERRRGFDYIHCETAIGPRDAMKLLMFLMESFIGAFGITRPRPEQERTVALVLGGFLLIFFTGLISLIVWMLASGHR